MKKPWLENWKVVEALGGGGQGVTSVVENRASQKGVLKVLVEKYKANPKARGRMSSEVSNLKILKSVGAKVPQVLEANSEDTADSETERYFVMEFIPGQTLDKLVNPPIGLSLEESVNICVALIQTLRVAHNQPIYHRDLKPENVMIRDFGAFDVVMLDFGISFHGTDGPNLTTHSESFHNGLIHLPERTGVEAGKRDPRSDLTDIAAILYYCLATQPPRNLEDGHGKPIHTTIQSKLKPKCFDEIQLRKLNGFFARGFQKDIRSRFQTVDEVERRLLDLLSPDTLTTNEDLEFVLRNSIKQLQLDKKTLIANFRRNIERGIQEFEHKFDDLSVPVVMKQHGSFTPNSMELDFSLLNKNRDKTFVLLKPDIAERTIGNFDKDKIYFYQLALHNKDHHITALIVYEFQLAGSECVINRSIRDSGKNSQGSIVELAEKFSSPEDVDLARLFNDVKTSVKICIEQITEKISSGSAYV